MKKIDDLPRQARDKRKIWKLETKPEAQLLCFRTHHGDILFAQLHVLLALELPVVAIVPIEIEGVLPRHWR